MRKKRVWEMIKKCCIIILIIVILFQAGIVHSQKKRLSKNENTIKYYESEIFDEDGHIIKEHLENEIQDARENLQYSEDKITGLENELRIANEEIEKLKEELNEQDTEKLQTRIVELEEELRIKSGEITQQAINNISNGTYVNYMNTKFPTDGNYYKERYDRVVFYADPTCTNEIYVDLRFLSPAIDESQAKNGLKIYCLERDDGTIVYCTEYPDLITEIEYNESKD